MRAFKNNISIILITFLIPIISYSQKHQQVKPDGHIIEKQFNVNTYHGLNMAAMGKVYLTDGKVGEIKIKGDENIIELLNLKVINQVLNIDFKSPVSFNGEFELKNQPNRKVYFHTKKDTTIFKAIFDVVQEEF